MYRFASLSPQDLDDLVAEFNRDRPDDGLSYLMGFIRLKGLRVQRSRVRQAAARANPLRVLGRPQAKVIRRQYVVTRPNAVQHGDGYLKLNRYGYVLHGFIEGFARLVSLTSRVVMPL